MISKNKDLHGFAPEKSPVALILIDVINTMDFPESDKLLKNALPAIKNLSLLKQKAKKHKIPIIYVNDNFGEWRSDFKSLVKYCLKDESKSKELVELIKPDEEDYFILKPKFSAFFNTNLDILLKYLDTKSLIITGVAGNMCVFFTVADAYMRDFKIYVPSDCIASNEKKDNKKALNFMKEIMNADITSSKKLNLKSLANSKV